MFLLSLLLLLVGGRGRRCLLVLWGGGGVVCFFGGEGGSCLFLCICVFCLLFACFICLFWVFFYYLGGVCYACLLVYFMCFVPLFFSHKTCSDFSFVCLFVCLTHISQLACTDRIVNLSSHGRDCHEETLRHRVGGRAG